MPEEYIPPSLHNLCISKPTMSHSGDDYLCPTKILLPPEDNGERLLANGTIKVVEDIEKADGKASITSATILVLTMATWMKSSPGVT